MAEQGRREATAASKPTSDATKDPVRAIADAVLYEGFMLFPYRPSALKNRMPWQFGVLMPQEYADASEPRETRVEVLCEPRGEQPRVEIVARFLQIADEPIEREVPFAFDLRAGRTEVPFEIDVLHGRAAASVEHDGTLFRITFELRNDSTSPAGASRNEALHFALVSAHAILSAQDAVFLSQLDPPERAKAAAERCRNRQLFPVLAGKPGDSGNSAAQLLASPIILYDFPAIAEPSRGHTFDATEIDELLLLSVSSLTDEEKREARAAHPMTRELVDRADALDARSIDSLHGKTTVTREPGDETVVIAGTPVCKGSRVRVHPKGGTDVFDTFVEGMSARVCAVHTDFDGERYVGVVFEDDPASEMHEWYGRSFLYRAEEIEPLEALT